MIFGRWSVAGCSSDEGSKKQTHIVGNRGERMPVRSELHSLGSRDGHSFYRQKGIMVWKGIFRTSIIIPSSFNSSTDRSIPQAQTTAQATGSSAKIVYLVSKT